jgi:steroid 5-alpha reductase family enzyme
VAALAGVWSARLAWYLLVDRVLPAGEDGRWQALRDRWGGGAPAGFFLVFQLQALLAVLLSGAYFLAMRVPTPGVRVWDLLGAAIALSAVVGESIADRQLARWRADPAYRSRTCRDGLWRYSRHPNYFFEWLHWWAWPVIAIGAPWGWIAVYAPLLMLVFILKLSGIPATERRALVTRGEDYRRYQRTTSAFIPWPPRQRADSASRAANG